jgi:hypothetical protein
VASHEAAATQTAAGQPQLAPSGQKPLKVKGTGFQPGEKVLVATKGVPSQTTVASSAGTFVVSLPGVDSCDSINVVANGSRGSHAEFNLSQIACLDPS